MTSNLRRALMATATGLCMLATGTAFAQDFPSKAVTIIVPYQAGGGTDAIARPLASKLSKKWGQPVVVENRPGANGMIATQTAIRSEPDGHTILYHLTGIIQNPLLLKNVAYDPMKDVIPVFQIGGQALALTVPRSSAVNSLDQLVTDGKSKGDRGLIYGTVGVGHSSHIWSELLASERKFKATHAAYKGTVPLVIDLVSGRLDWAFIAPNEALIRTNDNTLKALTVTGTKRVKQLPGVATMHELGYPGFEMVGWHGLFVPAGTPATVVNKIEVDVREAMGDPEIQKILDTQVVDYTGYGSAEFGKVMRNDSAGWAALFKRFNIQIN
ncbi:tripartite tricarboxylate transporter substrate binding protein [Alcaligenaceae bacterium]|nr:tripartite tricarboxylate transporter substrate binding protein [Alcaligenaceae bacterium]